MIDRIHSVPIIPEEPISISYPEKTTGTPQNLVGEENHSMKGLKALACYNQAFVRSPYKSNTKIYTRQEKAQESFTADGITFETTPVEIINYMHQNNIPHKTTKRGEKDNNRSVSISEFDQNGKKIKEYCWYYGKNGFDEPASIVSVSDIDNHGNEITSTSFSDTEAHVTRYYYKK